MSVERAVRPTRVTAVTMLTHTPRDASRSLALNGSALMLNAAASGMLGFAFWVVAAHSATPEVVGRATALTVTVMALASLCQQNLVVTLPTLIATAPDPRRLARTAYAVAAGLTFVAALVYVFAAPQLFTGLHFIRDDPVLAIAVIVCCVIWSIFSLQDSVLAGAQRGVLVLAENSGWGIARIALLVPLGAVGIVTLRNMLFIWIAPAFLLVLLISWYLFRSPASPIAQPLGASDLTRRQLWSYVGPETAASIAQSLAALALPAVALTKLHGAEPAAFMAAYSIVLVFETALSAFGLALAVELTKATTRDRDLKRVAGALFAVVVGLIVVGAWFGSGALMGLFGREYRRIGGQALEILAIGLPARSVWLFANAVNRSRRNGWANAVLQFVYTAAFFAILATGVATTVTRLALILVACRVVTAVTAVVVEAEQRRRPGAAATPFEALG